MRGQLRLRAGAATGCLILALAACGGSRPTASGLVFERTVLDVGTLISGETRTLRFPFAVEGSEPVRMERLVPGCGCLEPQLEVDGRPHDLGAPLEPGAEGAVVVRYVTSGFQGRKDTLLQVEGQGRGLPAELEVRSQLEPWLVAEPAGFTAQSLEGDGPWTVDFLVTGREDHRLLEVQGLPQGVSIDGLPSPVTARQHRFRLTIDADCAPGDHAWFLKLWADNGLSTILPFQYRRELEVWTRPGRVIRLGVVAAESEVHATLDIGTSRGELAVAEYRLEGLPESRLELLNLTPSRTYRLRLAIPAGPEPGVLSGKLHLKLTHTVDGRVQNLDRQLVIAGVVE